MLNENAVKKIIKLYENDNKNNVLKAGVAGTGTLGGVVGLMHLTNKVSPASNNPLAHHLTNKFAEILSNQ